MTDSRKITDLHPKVANLAKQFIAKCKEHKIDVIITSTYRSNKKQAELYAQGRTKLGKIVTNAKGGLSYHNYGMAIDIVLIANGAASWDSGKDFDADGKADWMEVVSIFKQFGWEAGIDWKFRDAPHFQKSLGYSVRQLVAMHQSGMVDNHGFVKI